jgi:hypothetical protein
MQKSKIIFKEEFCNINDAKNMLESGRCSTDKNYKK